MIARIEQSGWAGQLTPEIVKKEVDKESVILIKKMGNLRSKKFAFDTWYDFSCNAVCEGC